MKYTSEMVIVDSCSYQKKKEGKNKAYNSYENA